MSDAAPVPVSVVIPCFRCSSTIGRALTSVLDQSVQPSEIILVDDFSNDGTINVLNEWYLRHPSIIKIIAMNENRGAGSARNFGWDLATQPFVAFLDADDTWHPRKLEVQYSRMAADSEISLCGHLCTLHEHGDASLLDLASVQSSGISKYAWLFKNAFSTPTVMLKRELPLRFLSGRRHSEDYLLWQQIAFAGYCIARIDAPLAHVHKPFYGASGLSAQMWEMEKGELLNFNLLRKDGSIGLFLFSLASIFSLLKFFRRYLIIRLQSWVPAAYR